jgi:hypothetical protein
MPASMRRNCTGDSDALRCVDAGPHPAAAVKPFTQPPQLALSCFGNVKITLSQRARETVGERHSWTLNDGTPIALGDGLFFRALMKFETLDRGQSERRKRYRITTREYIYEITGPKSQQDISAHWHPLARNSRFADPQSTKDQILSSELHGQALLAAKRPELQPLIDHVCEVAHGRDDIRTECAGSHCRRVVASK